MTATTNGAIFPSYVFACNQNEALQPAHTYRRHGRLYYWVWLRLTI